MVDLDLFQVRKLLRETYWRLLGVNYTYDLDAEITADNRNPVRRLNLGSALGVDSVKAALVNHSPSAWLLDRAYRYKKFGIRELTGWDLDKFLELPPEAVEEWFEVAALVKAREASDRKRAEDEAKRRAERGSAGGG